MRYFTGLRSDRSIVTVFLQFGHLISMTPVVGVTLSKMRQLQAGHLFTIFIAFSFSISDSSVDINEVIRVIQIIPIQFSK